VVGYGPGSTLRIVLATVHAAYVPNRVLTVAAEGEEQARQRALVPLVAEKQKLHGTATVYACEQRVCSLPTSSPPSVPTRVRQRGGDSLL